MVVKIIIFVKILKIALGSHDSKAIQNKLGVLTSQNFLINEAL
jgi:hypothetical protein